MHLTVFFGIILYFLSNINHIGASQDVEFKLYKRENPTSFAVLKENGFLDSFFYKPYFSKSFDINLPTRIYIYDFRSTDKMIDTFREKILSVGNFNFIVADWNKNVKEKNPTKVKSSAIEVSKKIAELIDALGEIGMNFSDLTIIGHGLGALIAGWASQKLKSSEKIGCIIALNPASLGFYYVDGSKSLTNTSASYVEIIHTDISQFGVVRPFGHANFFPNRGVFQPGCIQSNQSISSMFNLLVSTKDSCSHTRALEFFWESLTSNFTAIQCASYEEIKDRRCTFNDVITTMGGNITLTTNKPHGVFYLETNANSPFLIQDHNLFRNINITSNNDTQIEEIIQVELEKVSEQKQRSDQNDFMYDPIGKNEKTSEQNNTYEESAEREGFQDLSSFLNGINEAKPLHELDEENNQNKRNESDKIDDKKNDQNDEQDEPEIQNEQTELNDRKDPEAQTESVKNVEPNANGNEEETTVLGTIFNWIKDVGNSIIRFVRTAISSIYLFGEYLSGLIFS